MKIQVYRQSGMPVNESDQAGYTAEWKAFYDKAEARAKERFSDDNESEPYFMLLERYLRYGERQLVKKYNVAVEVELPKTVRGWTKLMETYQDTPVILARRQDSGKLILIIADTLQG